MAAKVAAFVHSLQEFQLVDQTKMGELNRVAQGKGDDVGALARELVNKNLLTNFQANKLLRGNAEELAVGPYRLLEKLGEGGMGQVFKAFHCNMQRVVALKIIRKEKLAHPDAVKRFYQEVQHTGKLAHPNIVMAFDAGQENGTHYLAMEYVEGIDLAKLVKQHGPLPVPEACDYIRQAALGLQCAFERGLVHRDIKPANVLLATPHSPPSQGGDRGPHSPPSQGGDRGGVIKVLDLGLARIQGDDTSNLTRVGTVVGTPEYLAPEQAKNSRTVDIRADLYSLGCTFYYLLAASAPFKGGSVMDVLLKHMSEEAKPIEQVRPEVPPQLGLVIRKLMAKKPEDRYQTPADLILALAPFLRRGGADILTPSTTGRQGRRPSATINTAVIVKKIKRRSPKRRLVVAAVAFLFLAGLTMAGYYTLRGNRADKSAAKGTEVAKGTGSSALPSSSRPQVDTQPKIDPLVPTPKVDSPPPPDPNERRRQVPTSERLAEAEQALRARYEADYAKTKPADKAEFAARLLQEGERYRPKQLGVFLIGMRFVLFREARNLAAEAGAIDLALRAVDELDRYYDIQRFPMKLDALERAIRSNPTPAVFRSAVEHAFRVCDQAVETDLFPPAYRCLGIAQAAANQLNDQPLSQQILARQRVVREIHHEHARLLDAPERLANMPDDPEANYRVGRFRCFFKGGWSAGLANLRKGSDARLRALAERDLAGPRDALEQVQVGNGWWAVADSENSPLAKRNIYRHARQWYERALPQLSGETRADIQRRLQQLPVEIR